MGLAKYIACICEGGAEQKIIELLLDANKLIFTYEDLLEGEVLRCRNATTFEREHLRKGFNGKITVYRILDSRRENFNLSRAYIDKIDVVNVITAPEIEMLVIFHENEYVNYKKSGKKPSTFCKENLGLSDVKSKAFIAKYFADIDVLVAAIDEYKRVCKVQRGEIALADLIAR